MEMGDLLVLVLYLVAGGIRIWLENGKPSRDWVFWAIMGVLALWVLVLPAFRAWRHW